MSFIFLGSIANYNGRCFLSQEKFSMNICFKCKWCEEACPSEDGENFEYECIKAFWNPKGAYHIGSKTIAGAVTPWPKFYPPENCPYLLEHTVN